MRLGAILSPLACRLLRLRDAREQAAAAPAANTPAALTALAPPLYIRLVAALARIDPLALTPRTFLLTIAKRGGYLGRTHDPRPGWKVLWRGWTEMVQMVQGAELLVTTAPPEI